MLKLPYKEGIATIQTSIVAQPDDLIIDSGDEPPQDNKKGVVPRDRNWWEKNANAQFMQTVDEVAKYCIRTWDPRGLTFLQIATFP